MHAKIDLSRNAFLAYDLLILMHFETLTSKGEALFCQAR